jgi:hypothetical protein
LHAVFDISKLQGMGVDEQLRYLQAMQSQIEAVASQLKAAAKWAACMRSDPFLFGRCGLDATQVEEDVNQASLTLTSFAPTNVLLVESLSTETARGH